MTQVKDRDTMDMSLLETEPTTNSEQNAKGQAASHNKRTLQLRPKGLDDTVEIVFLGDTSFGENYQQRIEESGRENILKTKGYDYPLAKMKALLTSADLVVANLETPLTDIKTSPYAGKKSYVHWSDIVKAPHHLLKHNIQVVSLANNHTFDYGKEGFAQTLNVLEKEKIHYFGAGRNQSEANEPFFINTTVGGLPFSCALIGAFQESKSYREDYQTYADGEHGGVTALDVDKIIRTIQVIKASNPDTTIIVFPHWGGNYAWKSDWQGKIANTLIANGADLILGHGAHMLQEIEQHQNKWVAFSIGNFMFNSPGRYEHFKAPPYSLVAKLIIKPTDNSLSLVCRLYPIISDNRKTEYQSTFVNEQQFNEVCKILTDKNTSANTQIDSLVRNKDEHGFYLDLPIVKNEYASETPQKNRVGLICNTRNGISPNRIAKKWMYRAVSMNEALRKQGIELFMYAYNHIDPDTGRVRGYIIENNHFIEKESAVPAINYDWFLGSKVNRHNNPMNYNQFSDWARNRGIAIYPNKAYTALSKDKYITYKTLAEFNKDISIYTEIYDNNSRQLENFLKKSSCLFLKPQFGNSGIGIIVIKKIKNQYTLTHYENGQQAYLTLNSLDATLSEAKKIILNTPYVIQQGVFTSRINSSTFDIRMVVIGHQNSWAVMPEVRLGAKESDLSNVAQGGSCIELDDFLCKLPLKVPVAQFKKMLTDRVIQLTSFLDAYAPTHLMEMAYDIILDTRLRMYITEINCKPGSPMIFTRFNNMLNLSENEQELYTKYIQPHGELLANSLQKRLLDRKDNQQKIWFDSISAPLSLTSDNKNALIRELYDAILNKRTFDLKNLPLSVVEDQSERIVFLSISNGFSKAQVSQGSGPGIVASLEQAMTKLPFLYKENYRPIWIKLDIVTECTTHPDFNLNKPLNFDRSLYGLAFAKDIDMAFLPDQMNAYTLVTSDSNLHLRNMGKYVSSNPHYSERYQTLKNLNQCTLYQFKTDSLYFDGDACIPLYRGHRQYHDISPELLLDSVDLATNYLIRSTGSTGKFNYSYEPKIDSDKSSYNILRHAGTIYSMLEAYEVTPTGMLLSAAQSAIRYLVQQLKEVTVNNETALVVVEDNHIKLGGNALAALAIAKFIQVTHDRTYFPTLLKLGKWIVSTQNSQGEFTIHKQSSSDGTRSNFVSEYYPGEALFALARIYQLDPQEHWLNCAENGALFLINVRDKELTDNQLSHDHWLLYALNEIYRLRKNDAIYSHAVRIASVIMKSQRTKSSTLDWIGSYYNPPRSTPTATRMEGLCASYHLIQDYGNQELAAAILASIKLGIIFQLQTQFLTESIMYLPNPQKALGGFHRSLTDFEIRIDYVQHNISSLLGLYKILRSSNFDDLA